MRKTPEEGLIRVHLYLHPEDTEWYKVMFGGAGGLGFSRAIREVMRNYRRGIEAKILQEQQAKGKRLTQAEKDEIVKEATGGAENG